jgi:hypothetical protein
MDGCVSGFAAAGSDDALVSEGRRRLQRSAPNLTDRQFFDWLDRVRAAGARLELTPDSIVARYDRQ